MSSRARLVGIRARPSRTLGSRVPRPFPRRWARVVVVRACPRSSLEGSSRSDRRSPSGASGEAPRVGRGTVLAGEGDDGRTGRRWRFRIARGDDRGESPLRLIAWGCAGTWETTQGPTGLGETSSIVSDRAAPPRPPTNAVRQGPEDHSAIRSRLGPSSDLVSPVFERVVVSGVGGQGLLSTIFGSDRISSWSG